MVAETKKRTLLPYISYKSFTNFINSLKETSIPSHIDSSVMSKMAGSVQSAMLSALKALNLVNDKAEPTQNLRELVNADSSEFSIKLQELTKSCYSFLFDNSINLETISGKKVEEKFRDAGAQGTTLTKCIAFFLAITKDAKIPVSVYIKTPKSNPAIRKNKPINNGESKPKLNNGDIVPPDNNREDSEDITNMVKITVPLRDTDDALIYFPKNIAVDKIKQAVKMANLILKNYYGIEEID